jgi:hypothetical protein
VDGREPYVSGGGDIVPLDFEIMKEVEHFLGPEIVDIQFGHGASLPCGDEAQQQDKRIPVTANGVRAGPSHARQVVSKEAAKRTAQRIR